MTSRTVFDIGMNNGDDTAYYLHKGFKVVAVEANPQLAESATRRFQGEIAAGRLTILNVGIADVEGVLPFWVCERHSEWSSFDRTVASRENSPHHVIEVATRRFDSILKEYGVPYYLKTDIEGHDELCLRSLQPGQLPEYISVEVSDLVLLDLLARLGYTRFKCISQYHYLPLQLPPSPQQRVYENAEGLLKNENALLRPLKKFGGRRVLEKVKRASRREGDWVFPFGSSGPFGESLPGNWMNHHQMRTTFERLKSMMQQGASSPFWTDKEYSLWADFHAAR